MPSLYSHGDDPSQIEGQTNAMASQIESILTDPPAAGPNKVSPAVSPAVNGSNFSGTLTGTQRPIVDLFRNVKF